MSVDVHVSMMHVSEHDYGGQKLTSSAILQPMYTVFEGSLFVFVSLLLLHRYIFPILCFFCFCL